MNDSFFFYRGTGAVLLFVEDYECAEDIAEAIEDLEALYGLPARVYVRHPKLLFPGVVNSDCRQLGFSWNDDELA
jgi:hypothetical protein